MTSARSLVSFGLSRLLYYNPAARDLATGRDGSYNRKADRQPILPTSVGLSPLELNPIPRFLPHVDVECNIKTSRSTRGTENEAN